MPRPGPVLSTRIRPLSAMGPVAGAAPAGDGRGEQNPGGYYLRIDRRLDDELLLLSRSCYCHHSRVRLSRRISARLHGPKRDLCVALLSLQGKPIHRFPIGW